jgi:hypothetical protein
LPRVMLLLSILVLMNSCLGPKTVIIPADKEVIRLGVGATYKATNWPVWIVPDARMQEIMAELERKNQ